MNIDRQDCISVRQGRLFIDERDAVGLAREFGTPLFVMSETQLRANVRRFRAAFSAEWTEGPVDVLPAFKANTTLATRHVLSNEGAGADVYSPQELDVASLGRRAERLRPFELASLDLVGVDRITEQGTALHRADPKRAAAAGLLLQNDADATAVLAGDVSDESLDLMRRGLRPCNV